MLHTVIGNVFSYLDYALSADGHLLALSVFGGSAMSVAATCANLSLGREELRIIDDDGKLAASYPCDAEMEHYHAKVQAGRETVCQGVSFSKRLHSDYWMIRKGMWEEDLYACLMNRFEYPLLREWAGYLKKRLLEEKILQKAVVRVLGDTDLFGEYDIFHSSLASGSLQKLLEEGLSSGYICIAGQGQKPLRFADMDDYFRLYGHTLVGNLEGILNPLSPMKETVDELAFIGKRPFPQQAAIINGAVACLDKKRYVFLVESMGAGKTLQGMGIAETLFNRRYLAGHPGKTIKDVYMDGNCVKYRVIIMCPPHLVEKWAQSIREEIPYARVEILEGLPQLVRLRKKGKRPEGKEYYILSKDAGKLSYSYIPVPYRLRHKKPKIPVCKNCGKEFLAGRAGACSCGCRERILDEQVGEVYGLVCPECGEILLPADGRKAVDEVLGEIRALTPLDFAQQNSMNRRCRCCGTSLWAPACKPVDDRILFRKPAEKPPRWKKISHYANRAKKGRKSVWVMTGWRDRYMEANQVTEEEIEEMDDYGPRRFGLTRYIKKYLKNYFGLAIFDEVQECGFS